jgi:palmitoyl transferase
MLAVSMAIRKTRLGHVLGACAAVAVLLAPIPAAGQEPDPPSAESDGFAASASASDTSEQSQGFWHRTGAGIKHLWGSGGSDVYVPGYIWHLPYKYSEEQISRYNTTAWGLGYGRTLKNGANHPQTLFGIVSADSYSKLQYMVGYSWRARWHVGGGPFSVGGGYTALVIGREDKFSYAPLPVVLPLGSVGVDRFELMGAYVPYFEVGYFFLRVNFGEGPRVSRQK